MVVPPKKGRSQIGSSPSQVVLWARGLVDGCEAFLIHDKALRVQRDFGPDYSIVNVGSRRSAGIAHPPYYIAAPHVLTVDEGRFGLEMAVECVEAVDVIDFDIPSQTAVLGYLLDHTVGSCQNGSAGAPGNVERTVKLLSARKRVNTISEP